MKSLRGRLMLGALLGALVVTGSCGVLLDYLVQRDMILRFDAALADQARTLGALIEYDEDGYQFEWDSESRDLPQWFLIRKPDGSILAGSRALRSLELPQPGALGEAIVDFELPDGASARAAVLRVAPRQDAEATQTAQPVTLVLAASTSTLDATLSRTRWLIALAALAALGLSLLAIALIVPGALRPLRSVATQIENLRVDTLHALDASGAPRELQPVVHQLNALLARVEDTLRREKEFAAGAAHELRTPLAGIRAKLELALSRQREPEDHRKLAQSALDISVSMQAIVQNLLLLARPAGTDTPGQREPVDLHDLLREQWQAFAGAATRKEAAMDWDLRAQGLIHAQRHTLQIVISNLLENAAEYVNDCGSIHVATENQAGNVVLRIANTGCNLTPEQAKRVFDPFWRGDESRTERAHAGLGLAICRRVATAMGGSIEASVTQGRFTVTLSLPAAT